jgi:exodeoxyribonuclease VII large subunit
MTENRDIFSVSRLNSELRHVLEGSFPLLWVQGEISNLSIPRSGHLYFSLKDSHAQIRCALFKGKANLLRFKPKDGDSVIARAKVALYEPRGDCQLIIESMEPAGEGALQKAFEALKLKLQKEGLFETSLKKELPAHPINIGIVTSSSGAAIRDMLNILSRRHPTATVTIYPCLVQGTEAPADIRQALNNALTRQQDDVIVLTRGGGSIEDLWAFNDEQLARDIAAADIPIVSAVGHEIDFTIADFVADRRAPTPSAAAELISPDQAQISQRVHQLNAQLTLRTQQSLAAKQKQLQQLEQRLTRQHPRARTQQQQQRLDEIQLRLQRSVSNTLLKQQTASQTT